MKAKVIMISSLVLLLAGALAMFVPDTSIAQERALINEGSITIDPDEGEELTGTGSPIRTAVPGDDLYFTLWINNDGNMTQTVIMELDRPEGWTVSITGSVQVQAGNRSSITLAVNVPTGLRMDPDAEYSIRVDGLANITGDRAFIIVIIDLEASIDHELIITPYNTKEQEFKLHPGQRTYIDILLRNQGDMIDDIDLRISEHQTSWKIKFQENAERLFVTLPAGESDSIFRTSILVEVPQNAQVGDFRTVSIITTSNMSAKYDTGKLRDQVDLHFRTVPSSTITIQPVETLVECESGDQLHLDFDATLTGAMRSTIEPYVRVMSGSFEQGGWMNTIDINGASTMEVGETRTITVHITPPSGTSGSFEIILDGLSDNARIMEGKMSVMVRSGSNLSFTDLSVGEAKLGSDILINFRVINNGDSSQQIVLDLEDVPTCFIPEVEPSSFILGPGRSRGINVILYPKHNDIPLEFTFRSNIKVPVDDVGEWLLVTEIFIPVTVKELPNVMVSSIILPNRPIDEGENIPINVTLSNPSALNMDEVTIEIYEITWSFSNVLITSEIIDIRSGEEVEMSFNWTARPSARKIRAILVAPEGSEETDSVDNDLTEPINVRPIRSGIGDDVGDDTGGKIDTEEAVAVVVGGSIILTSLALLANTDLIRYPFFSGIYPLYSKLKPEHLLSNRLRKRIYVYVQNNPGEHFRSILVNLNLTNGTLAHHLYTLERENLIRSQRDGLYRRFYPAGYQIDEDRVSLSPIQKRIMELLGSEPGLSQKDISQKLDLSNSTVNYNIKSLKEKGIIDITKEGKSTHIFPRDNGNS
jgi:uncharacterized membrane protein/DNA-binding MarR family transcriptional regulator